MYTCRHGHYSADFEHSGRLVACRQDPGADDDESQVEVTSRGATLCVQTRTHTHTHTCTTLHVDERNAHKTHTLRQREHRQQIQTHSTHATPPHTHVCYMHTHTCTHASYIHMHIRIHMHTYTHRALTHIPLLAVRRGARAACPYRAGVGSVPR